MNYVKRENINLIGRDSLLLNVLVALFSMAFIVLGVTSSVFTALAFGLAALYILYALPENTFYLLFLLIPFANIFKFSPGSTSLFTYLQLLMVVKILLTAKRINVKFILIWCIFFVYVTIGSQGNFTVLIKQAVIPLIIYCFVCFCNINLKTLSYFFLVGTLVSSVVAWNMKYIPNLSNYVVYDKVYGTNLVDTYRFSGLYSDPNYYSLILILTMICLLLLFVYKKMNYEAFLFVGIFTFFGAQTGSKSFLLMFAVTFGLYVLLLFINKRYLLGSFFTLAFIVMGVLILSGAIDMFATTIARLESGSSTSDLTTGRTDTWRVYMDYFDQNFTSLLFGSGVGSGLVGKYAAHNTYIDFLYYYGIFGTILFVITCVSAFCCKNKFRIKFSNCFPVFCIGTMFAFLSGLMHFDFAFILALLFFLIRFDFKKDFYDNGLEIKQ